MCGNIKKIRFPDRPATTAEIDAAVLQYVRKISDFRQPSADNQKLWDETRENIAGAVRELLTGLATIRASALQKGKFKARR